MNSRSALSSIRHGLIVLLALLCASSAGCIRRRLTVRSTPPGALVYVDRQFIGATPVSTDFTYYATRNIELIKDGYETHTVKQQFLPPWYELPPLDFVNENLNPYEIRDERELHFTLEAQRIMPVNELLDRADQLRHGAAQDVMTPLPQSLPAGAGEVWGAGVLGPGSAPAVSSPGPPAPLPPPWTEPAPREIMSPEAPGRFVAPPPGSIISPPPGLTQPPYTPLHESPGNDAAPPAGAWPDSGPSSYRRGPANENRGFY